LPGPSPVIGSGPALAAPVPRGGWALAVGPLPAAGSVVDCCGVGVGEPDAATPPTLPATGGGACVAVFGSGCVWFAGPGWVKPGNPPSVVVGRPFAGLPSAVLPTVVPDEPAPGGFVWGALITELPAVVPFVPGFVLGPDPDGFAPVLVGMPGPAVLGSVAVCGTGMDVPFWSCEPLPTVLPGASTGVTALEPFGPRLDELSWPVLVTGFADPSVLGPSVLLPEFCPAGPAPVPGPAVPAPAVPGPWLAGPDPAEPVPVPGPGPEVPPELAGPGDGAIAPCSSAPPAPGPGPPCADGSPVPEPTAPPESGPPVEVPESAEPAPPDGPGPPAVAPAEFAPVPTPEPLEPAPVPDPLAPWPAPAEPD
jgi:hypothetical protein